MFEFQDDRLCLKQGHCNVRLHDIARKEKTPFYLYDLDGMRDFSRVFRKALVPRAEVFYAMKANSNFQVLKVFQKEGLGVDVVSGGEMARAREAGFPPDKIIFSGVGKTREELKTAIEWGLLQINVESLEELKALAQTARRRRKKASVALRVNPGVDVETHPYIRTGRVDHKFGIDTAQIPSALDFIKQNREVLHFCGLSQHIGSQIFDLKSVSEAIQNLKSLYEKLLQEGFPLKTLDIGGGLGVDYGAVGLEKDCLLLKEYGKTLRKMFRGFPARVFLEPGRFLTARFGLLCVRVEYVKKTPRKTFAIVNSGLHHFLRPALYRAEHRILPFRQSAKKKIFDVVGVICETGDVFGKDVTLPPVKAGDWLAVADTGAYGYVMSNNYNLQLPVKEIPFSRGRCLSS